MSKLADGLLRPNTCPYVRNAQALSDHLYLVEAQDGLTGKGRVWYPALVYRNPNAGKLRDAYAGRPDLKPYMFVPEFSVVGEVKATKNWRRDHSPYQLTLRRGEQHRWLQAFFETDTKAIAFMLATAEEFLK